MAGVCQGLAGRSTLPFCHYYGFMNVSVSSSRCGLWNRNFCLLTVANTLLCTSVYMLFPVLHSMIVMEEEFTDLQAGLIVSVFGIALFIPGALGAWLVDRFKRKHVCVYSIIALALLSPLYQYVNELWMTVALRVLQGAFYGVILMSMGGTLVIDVTASPYRDKANAVFTWAGIIGMFLGVLVGLNGTLFFTYRGLLWISTALSVTALLSVAMVKV